MIKAKYYINPYGDHMKNINAKIALIVSVLLTISFAYVVSYAKSNNDNVLVTVTTDKSSYSLGQTATITVKAENKTGSDLTDVVLVINADKWMLTKSSASNVLEIGDLKNNESSELTIHCVINRHADGIGAFGKIYLFFNQLINRPIEFKSAFFSGRQSAIATGNVQHGRVNISFSGEVWYSYRYFIQTTTLPPVTDPIHIGD